jgi:hypothetical protein
MLEVSIAALSKLLEEEQLVTAPPKAEAKEALAVPNPAGP